MSLKYSDLFQLSLHIISHDKSKAEIIRVLNEKY